MIKMNNKIPVKPFSIFHFSFFMLFCVSPARAQIQEQLSQAPKLIVGITVDQFRGDYLQYFLHTFGEGGFKRLFNDGLVYSNVMYDYPDISSASAMATIFTGANPFHHGIPGDKRFDVDLLREVSIFHDANYMGNYTTENLSPNALMSSTVADELKIASKGKSKIYAIAPDAIQSIISGGHAANAAFWLEDDHGKWATSTYYKDIPAYVDDYNLTEPLSKKIDDFSWKPALPAYAAFPYTRKQSAFHHYFRTDDRFRLFKTSPFVNTEVTNLFDKFLKHANLGKNGYPDMLLLTYYAGAYKEQEDKSFSWEIQDTYYRLDKEIESILNLVDKHIGFKNAVFFIASTGYFPVAEIQPDVMPVAGYFYPNRCVSLLNLHLMFLYGEGNWVTGYYNNQIFLNRKLIEDKQIHLADIQRKAAEFTIQFSGVQDVSTLMETLHGNWNESVARFRNGIYNGISGDIVIELKPGWILVDEKSSTQWTQSSNRAIIAPLIFFGQQIVPQRIFKTVKATRIAPTITHILRIRPPNAAKEAPLEEFM
jgi:hypothetical protein